MTSLLLPGTTNFVFSTTLARFALGAVVVFQYSDRSIHYPFALAVNFVGAMRDGFDQMGTFGISIELRHAILLIY